MLDIFPSNEGVENCSAETVSINIDRSSVQGLPDVHMVGLLSTLSPACDRAGQGVFDTETSPARLELVVKASLIKDNVELTKLLVSSSDSSDTSSCLGCIKSRLKTDKGGDSEPVKVFKDFALYRKSGVHPSRSVQSVILLFIPFSKLVRLTLIVINGISPSSSALSC